MVVTADIISGNLVVCIAPSYSLDGNHTSATVDLDISIDAGFTFYRTSSQYFQYYLDPIITSVLPKVAIEGSTFALTFSGSSFRTLYHASEVMAMRRHNEVCRFGTATFPLMVASDSAAYCFVDSMPAVGAHAVGVSLNGQEFTFFSDFV